MDSTVPKAHFLLSKVIHLKYVFYLFKRQYERKGEKEKKEIFCPLIYSADGCNDLAQVKSRSPELQPDL